MVHTPLMDHFCFGGDTAIIRLHGPNRADIEEVTGGKWGEIVDPRDDIDRLAKMLADLESTVFLYVNNHFEGSAPRTISKILGCVFE